jgi:hypothetical protein
MRGPKVIARVADRDRRASERIRRGIELIEQAPAEALYRKLLETLTRAGADADQHQTGEVSRGIVFAYKLAIELGGKLNLVSEGDLALRRRLAAQLFGEGEPHIGDEVVWRDRGNVRAPGEHGVGR